MPIAIAIHHPQPEHREDWIARMRETGRGSAALPGLMGPVAGYAEVDGPRLVGVSRWESLEALTAGIAAIKQLSDQADAAWGQQPTDVIVLRDI